MIHSKISGFALHNFSHWNDEDSVYTGQLLLIFFDSRYRYLTVHLILTCAHFYKHVPDKNMFLTWNVLRSHEFITDMNQLFPPIDSVWKSLTKKASQKSLHKKGFTYVRSWMHGFSNACTVILLGQSLVVNTLPPHTALYDSHTKYGVK